MHKAIKVLMEEHRLIEQALGSLETYAADIRAGTLAHGEVIADYASFFRGFADTCHHGKEEDILFQRLAERGMPRQVGPLAVMIHEHELGRAHVRAFGEIAESSGSSGIVDAPRLLRHADEYVPLLRQHILKEDHVLYPMALGMLTGSEFDAMCTAFEEFEAQMHVDGSYDRLRTLAERLATRFRPDPARMTAAGQIAHCVHAQTGGPC